jgi:hypothetical protein
MKKLFVLVSCVVALFVLNNFVQAADTATSEPCTCPNCVALSSFAQQAASQPAAQGLKARRAAKKAQPQGVPFQMSVRGLAAVPPVAAPVVAPAKYPLYPAAQMGDSNKVFQKTSVGGAPVVNFLSIVRAPRSYDAYPSFGGYLPAPAAE